MYFSSSSLSNSGLWECFLVRKLYQETGGICWHSKLAWPKASKVKVRITNSILISIILQVWHVWPLCRIWRSFWDILDMISSMRQRSIQNSIKMRSNHELSAPRWSPHRDDRNEYMDRLIWSPDVGNMATGSFPVCINLVCPDLVTGLTGFGQISPN